MLRMAVQPSTHVRPGIILSTPVVARLSSEHSIYDGLSMMYAVATLIDESGETLYDQLGGRITDSAHPMNEREYGSRSNGRGSRQDRAYFCFPDLVINEPGRYRIRVSLMRMDYSTGEGTVTVEEQVDTRSILVDQEVTNYSSPSELPLIMVTLGTKTMLTDLDGVERDFLRILQDDGQEVGYY